MSVIFTLNIYNILYINNLMIKLGNKGKQQSKIKSEIKPDINRILFMEL
jgi:hypothetical protein